MVYKKCIAVILALCFLVGTSALCADTKSKEYYCKEARRLERAKERARQRLDEYQTSKYRTQNMQMYYQNQVQDAQKDYDDFVADSYREGAQPGWLRCQFD